MAASDYTDLQRRAAAGAALTRRNAGERKWLGHVAGEWNVATRTLRNWIDEFYPESAAGPEPETRRTPYPLRGIAWCGGCRRPMTCGRAGTDRAYLCPPTCLRRGAITADALHDGVLTAVTRSAATVLRRYAGGADPDIYLVPGLILRVTVGVIADDLRLVWRPNGYDLQAAQRQAAPRRPAVVPRPRADAVLLL